MPKTAEELEAEMKALEEKHASELAAKDTIIEERDSTIAKHQEEINALRKDLKQFKETEFNAAIEEYNSIYSQLSEKQKELPLFKKPKAFTMEEINSVRNITKSFKGILSDETHGIKPPRRSSPPSGEDAPEVDPAKWELDK
jgi:chromosome segregation ATPase